MQSLKAIAIVDETNMISLQMLFAADRRAEWQAELDALSAKIAPKTHSMRIIDVLITERSTHAGWRYRFNPNDAWTLVNDRPTGVPPTGEIEELFA